MPDRVGKPGPSVPVPDRGGKPGPSAPMPDRVGKPVSSAPLPGRAGEPGSTVPIAEGASGFDRAELEAWDDAHLWHPFTPQSVYRDEDPLLVVAGEGNYLIDIDGRRYLDGVASLWCNTLGHRRPELDRAVHDQLGRIAHATLLGSATVPAIRLARRLAEAAPPGLTRVFFSDNGSTAVEVAVKIALQYWQQVDGGRQARRTRFLGLGEAYHGDTVGSVAMGGIDLFHRRFGPLLFDAVRSPSPYCYRCPLDKEPETCEVACATELERLVGEHGDELAAVVIEPGFLGAGGIITYPPGFLRRAREVTTQASALLIFDEVAAGMGRSGFLFASQREDVTPDLLCVAKGLTGGYLPVAATLATEQIYEAFLGPPEDERTFFHGHTFTGNPLGAAAALATLDVLEQGGVLDGLDDKITQLAAELERLRTLPAVGDIRQYGLAAGVELVADRASRAPFPAAARTGAKVCRAARERGVFLRPLGDVIVLMPPLTVESAEITCLVDAVEHGIRTVCG